METKYVFRGLAGPLVNLWRVEQSIDHVVPFVISHRTENGGADPSIEQIKQARNVRRRLDDDLVDYDAFGDEDAPQEEEDEIESDQEQNEPDHESVGSGVIGERETV